MSTDKLLAVHRFAAHFHGGLSSPGYRLLCRASRRLKAKGITHPLDHPMSPRAAGYYGHLIRKWAGYVETKW